ncbi:hypothetical protein HNQ35_001250 [Cerasibacillus quisquiliarum]|uniref:Uncharacterized protein n=1 Tax=Cerasibacillus quisquiliarum TaxID=227865 RepID=A0A511V4J4_9BACI|nr:hypothetical protein [Cerasibacillus quisquiliarum]MBB5146049.1 hypothetical protein [Cerasibacillus quisquiliarum]GEN32172.1 hypothetical protein CQU01_24100 [Cerasibacillus quisquiliarum]
MHERIIYILFMDTGTYLSRLIHLYTKQSLNHVSIAFDKELTEVYSFGRKRPRNPFSGGFVREDIRSKYLRHARCALYTFRLTEAEYEQIRHLVSQFERNKDQYRYNFLGLLGFLFRIKIKRKRAFFCSQFVATLLRHSQSFKLTKPTCFTKPEDIRCQEGMTLIYQGILGDYDRQPMMVNEEIVHMKKASLMFLLKNKVREMVMR